MNLRNTLVSICLLLSGFSVFAGDDWKSYFKNSEVEILYRYSDCHDIPNGLHQQKILLKLVNLQDKKVEIFFNKELTFSNTSATKPDVREFSVFLGPLDKAEGDCDTKDNRLYIFSKQLNFNSTHLTHFELKNISVKPVQ